MPPGARSPGVSVKAITKPRRRQNHCCDQCRRSKRACDATGRAVAEVCSNCARTGKVCTFEKLRRTVAQITSKQGVKEATPYKSPVNDHASPEKRAATAQTPVFPVEVLFGSRQSSFDQTVSCSNEDFMEIAAYFSAPDRKSVGKEDRSASESSESWAPPALPTPAESGLGQPFDTSTLDAGSVFNAAELNPLDLGDQDLEDTDSSIFSVAGAIHNDDPIDMQLGGTSGFELPSSRRSSSSSSSFPDPSSDTMLYRLAEKTNKSLILDSLTRIYHDTMENALSCWLTERTCPYTYEGIVDHQISNNCNTAVEGSTTFKTPVVSRICQLDRPNSILRERPLTPRENQAASRALKAAIMAFAAQWAPSTCDRMAAMTSGTGTEATTSGSVGQRSPTFNRSLQERLWNEARHILQETAGLDSFRVVFAQLVFSFTQKPLPREDHERITRLRAKRGNSIHASPDVGGTQYMQGDMSARGSAVLAANYGVDSEVGELEELKELLKLQGPPIYLETALMRLSDKRARLEQLGGGSRLGAAHPVSVSDRKTFNLLFWMVMMCDTLVAALQGRSFVVSDEDSLILGAEESSHSPSCASLGTAEEEQTGTGWPASTLIQDENLETTPWGTFFLRRDGLTKPGNCSQWPFSNDHASNLLSDATPIKVLLYRRVKRLRNLLFRRAPPRKVEAGIVQALTVYEHWNKTYGDFMFTCLKHHDELSPRIQSWYTVLLGHWHLAAFLLSDCLELIDRHHKGDKVYGALRQSCRLVFEIRKTSAFQVAEVCRVGRPRYNSSFHQSNDFHTTVNEGAILTEPWTEILIRCFARSADHFLKWLSDCRSGNLSHWVGPDDCQTLYNNCAHCVGGLFDLGRKSDMAYLAALSFSDRLKEFPNPWQDPGSTWS
ncbi:Regulatory protein alcR [Exophiala dermatitidis]|uniref:Zn(2)-C6 fungal-type domain-containing protein n=1 Tax=Exophiala dermatitidis (strain ATCC 34100 / CBS 525.76 / NIH/UT8656) TaxID=858893 RepID=H6BRV1_EXODN|nr:uncharacterized protein HMPREF1120_02230 [Exophiala dermatitidis NIH/UT8656]EHY54053.1 hypothetical protein HMPREF1120_02230 [Exophiala dermatitidis NIH/UT8656]